MFFQDCFDRGQYILMADVTESEIRDAEIILGTKGIHGFYIFDPHNNNNSTLITSDRVSPMPVH